eukprot:7545142-Ditylum_brightwellii.AAC.2
MSATISVVQPCGTFDVPHWYRQVEDNERVGVGGVPGNNEGKFGDVTQVEPDAHVGISKIYFAYEHWAKGGVGATNVLEEALEGAPDLHCFGWVSGANGQIDMAPRVVVDELVALVALGYGCHRHEPEVGQLSDGAAGEHDNVPHFYLFVEFITNKCCFNGCRFVASVLERLLAFW